MKKNIITMMMVCMMSVNVFASVSPSYNGPVLEIEDKIELTKLVPAMKQNDNLIVESVRVGYNGDIPIIKTPQGKVISIIDNIEFSSIGGLLKKYTDAMDIEKIDILVINSMGDYGVQYLETLFESTGIIIDKVYVNIDINENNFNTKLNKKILEYYKDKIVEIEQNEEIEIEEDLTINLINKEHKNYYPNSDYYEMNNILYGKVLKYKNNEIAWINNNPRMEEFNESIRKEQELDCDVAIFNAMPRYSIFEEDVNLFDEIMMKTITPQNVLVQYSPNNFEGYDTNTNSELNELTNIINSGGAIPYYSYKFNSRTTIECDGSEGGITIKQEQIPRTVME